MNKTILLILVYLFCVVHVSSQNPLKFDPNLILENSRSLVLPPKASSTVYGQVAYSVREEITTSIEKDIYKIEFDLVSNEKGKKPFTNMVVGKSPHGDSWSFRIQHNEFHITSNTDESLHLIVNKNLGVNGKIGVGVSFPKSELDINGTIRAKEVKIEATGWSDFVFAKDYKLPALSDVETHIKEYRHLPDMPSESDVLENGISMGEMQAKLLQKIEELTLYVIELEKEIKSLKSNQ
ncbi:MAG: hypothetical protein LBS20_13305 [Prevotella sp.]|jgi:hypothetical protein|nr:hypothetical protein [Prevotella sp.]